MRPQVGRAWLYAGVFLVAAAVYWPTVFHDYGFRDDYAHLRETRETPAQLVRFTSSYGRPLYGALLVASVRPLAGQVANLYALRLGSVALLALVGIALMRLLERIGWPRIDSTAAGIAIVLLPAAQVTVAWSIAWPIALGLLLSLGGFAAMAAALARTGSSRLRLWSLAALAYLAAGLVYQPSALFFVVPLAASLLVSEDPARVRVHSTLAHLITAFGSIAFGFVSMRVVHMLGIVNASGVTAVETDPIGKLAWFVSVPLANALGIFALRDSVATSGIFWIVVAIVIGLIGTGFWYRRPKGAAAKASFLFCLLALPFAAFAANLGAHLRVPSYRTTYALAGLVLVLVVYTLRNLFVAGRIGRRVHCAALGLMLASGAVLANRHAYALIAEPQGWEWHIMLDAVLPLRLEKGMNVYVIRTQRDDRGTKRIFADEFGSLSSDTDWCVSEMFKSALRQRFPAGLPADFKYRLTSGVEAPPDGVYDRVIDMRRLKSHRALVVDELYTASP